MNKNKHTHAHSSCDQLSEYYIGFKLNNYYIADNNHLFVTKGRTFCQLCFKRRYMSQFDLKPIHQLSEQTFQLASTLDNNIDTKKFWYMYSIGNKQLVKKFEFSAYDDCIHCQKKKPSSKTKIQKHYERLLTLNSTPKLEELKQQVFSFGFANNFYCANKLGFDNPEFEKIMGGNYFARIFYRSTAIDGQIINSNTIGLSTDQDLAIIKSFMEYIERYTLSLQLAQLQTQKYDDVLIQRFLKRYKPPTSDKDLSLIKQSACWGLNLITNQVHPIPLRFIYNKGDLSHIKSTSSGFGAHISFKQALSSSILELIERDAFVRFWHEPLRAYNFIPEQDIQTDMEHITSALKIMLNNKSIICKYFVIESPTKLPVTLLTISSSDTSNVPSLLFGVGSGYSLHHALTSALDELRVNVCNLIEGITKMPNFFNKTFNGTIEELADRFHFYLTSAPRSKLAFLDMDNPLPDEIYLEAEKDNFSELLERFSREDMEIYGIDMTPKCFKDKNVYVTRAFSPDLYPLQFENENVFDLPTGRLSVKGELPHFFI